MSLDGEWSVCDGTGHGLNAQPGCMRYVQSTGKNGETSIVAKVWSESGDYEAVTRLIACAPAMLAALRLADDALDFSQAQVDNDRDRGRLVDWRRQIQSVLERVSVA